jgi:phosphate transport system permease protein
MQAATAISAARAAAAASRKGTPRSPAARDRREFAVRGALFGSALLSVATTATIIGILASESIRFFGMPGVSVTDFLFGTTWTPLLGADKHFGIWPLLCGTFLITAIAAAFALPVGLIAAIYLSEYARPRVRAAVKPALEVLAGIPTVVYGYFALTVITPFLHDHVSERFGTFNALGAGIAVGIMILPIVASLSEDSLRAVPRSLRDAALALGGTRFDVSVKVVVPAALSGIMASWLLAITRAIGETMIVALAAGGMAAMTLSPTAEVQTMTAYMVQIFLGDAPATGVEYRSSYAVATVLFVVTLGLTLAGNLVLRRFREEYD